MVSDTKLKILFILHLPPPIHGSSVVGEQIKNSKIVNETFNCRYIDIGTTINLEQIGKHNVIKLFKFLHALIRVIAILITWKPQLCYFAINAKGLAFYRDSILVLFVKLFGAKMVFHFHNKGVSTKQDNRLDNIIYSAVFKNAKFILLSKYLYSDIAKYVPADRVFYCPNGVPDFQQTTSSFQNKKNSEIINILFLSNLIETKGVFVLLESCKILFEKNLPFYCRFIGSEGDISKDCFNNKVLELGLTNSVSYEGRKTGKDKVDAYCLADIFAFPTYYHNETFGLVNIEAMQFSLPVISTYEGGIPEVVKDGVTGYLVPKLNPTALAEKLEILILNPELRQKMGIAGRDRYEKKFTQTIFEKRIVQILKST